MLLTFNIARSFFNAPAPNPMKKALLSFMVLSIAFYACKKNDNNKTG